VLPIERQGDPVHLVAPAETRNALYVLRAVDGRSNLLRIGSLIEGAALDKYSFTRDAYLQKRRAEIVEGKDSDGEEPEADSAPARRGDAAAPPAKPASR
jgi:phospholipid-binding lipoprotein MlaA